VRFRLLSALDGASAAGVDALVAAAPNGHFTQHPGWPAAEHGGEILHLIGESNGTVELAASVRLRPTVLGLLLADVFRGPVARDSATLLEGLQALEHLLRGRRLLALRVDPYWRGPGSDDVRRALQALGYRPMSEPSWHTRTLSVPLDDDEAAQLARFRPATRRQIKKALRMPITVREDLDDAGLHAFFALYTQMVARKSASPRSLAHLRANRDLFRAWPRRGSLLSSWCEGQVLAIIALFTFERRAIYALGASSAQAPEIPKAHLLHFVAMRRARARGCTSYDFGGYTDVAEGAPETATQKINQFKSGFGGAPEELVGGHERVLRPTSYRLLRTLHHARLALDVARKERIQP
jgi:lipid II:glycine glycyltransferase (peptidoglycan interpeptide bridge formation enzyme)